MAPSEGESQAPAAGIGPEGARPLGIAILASIVAIALAGMLWMTLGGGAATLAALVQSLEARVSANMGSALAIFAVLVFLIQLVALPGGTIAVLSGGFLFGAPLAAAVYYLAQVAAAPVVYAAVRAGIGPSPAWGLPTLARKRLPASLADAMTRAKEEAVLAVVVFRLAPILTSTFVPALSAVLGLPMRALIVGSLLVSWIKPSMTASIGAAARSLTEAADAKLMLSHIGAAPFAMVFAAAVGLLVVRLVLPRRK